MIYLMIALSVYAAYVILLFIIIGAWVQRAL